MSIKFKIVVCLLLLFIPLKSFAENIYNQPYLGAFPDLYKEKFSAAAWKQKTSANLAEIVRQSDLIILAKTERIAKAIESTDRITIYDADVKILSTYKGKAITETLSLKFEASATGIENGSKHIFFLKQSADNTKLLKASFIFPRGEGYDNHMRIIGAFDCSEDVGIAVINYLITRKLPIDLEERLINEYLSDEWGKMYTAVHLAFATSPAIGTSVLKRAVSVKERKRFDLELYGIAAFGLAIERKAENWRTLLENIPSFEGAGRMPESIAFDLAATFGDETTVPVIKEVIAKKPELAVSAAFALSRIKGKEAKSLVESWLSNEQLGKREELISNGWVQQKINSSILFKIALEEMEGTSTLKPKVLGMFLL